MFSIHTVLYHITAKKVYNRSKEDKPGYFCVCWLPGWAGLMHTWRNCRARTRFCAACPPCWRQIDGRYWRRSTLSWRCDQSHTKAAPALWSTVNVEKYHAVNGNNDGYVPTENNIVVSDYEIIITILLLLIITIKFLVRTHSHIIIIFLLLG